MKELGEAKIRLLRDSNFSLTLGRNVRKIILDRFSLKYVAEKYNQVYNELV